MSFLFEKNGKNSIIKLMKILKPSFYDNFKCLADDCKNSCCSAGWQISVSKNEIAKLQFCGDDSLAKNENFVKCQNEFCINLLDKKCPYFENGLCDIVLKKGNDFLFDVCKNFPRNFNKTKSHLEMRLSIACEEVCRLLLKQEKFEFKTENNHNLMIKTNDKNFETRQQIINILQDRTKNLMQRVESVNTLVGTTMPTFDGSNFEKLEWLEDKNRKLFCDIKPLKDFESETFSEIQIENLFVYFVFNYFANVSIKFCDSAIFKFCAFSVMCCLSLAEKLEKSNYEIKAIDAMLMFGREIESSSKNVEIILENLK